MSQEAKAVGNDEWTIYFKPEPKPKGVKKRVAIICHHCGAKKEVAPSYIEGCHRYNERERKKGEPVEVVFPEHRSKPSGGWGLTDPDQTAAVRPKSFMRHRSAFASK